MFVLISNSIFLMTLCVKFLKMCVSQDSLCWSQRVNGPLKRLLASPPAMLLLPIILTQEWAQAAQKQTSGTVGQNEWNQGRMGNVGCLVPIPWRFPSREATRGAVPRLTETQSCVPRVVRLQWFHCESYGSPSTTCSLASFSASPCPDHLFCREKSLNWLQGLGKW